MILLYSTPAGLPAEAGGEGGRRGEQTNGVVAKIRSNFFQNTALVCGDPLPLLLSLYFFISVLLFALYYQKTKITNYTDSCRAVGLGQKQQSSQKSLAYCGWGFWHGFMAAYAQGHTDISSLNSMCLDLPQELHAQEDCFHGVGIGALGDPPKTPRDALVICDQLSNVPIYIQIVSGVAAGAANANDTDNKIMDLFTKCSKATRSPRACIDGIISGELGKGNQEEKIKIIETWRQLLLQEDKEHCTKTLSFMVQ